MITAEPADDPDLAGDNDVTTTNLHENETKHLEANIDTDVDTSSVDISSADATVDNDNNDSLKPEVHDLPIKENSLDIDAPVVEEKVEEQPWYSSKKRQLRAMREMDEDNREEQRSLRRELRETDWRKKLGKSSVIRIKLPSKSKYQCEMTSPLGFNTAEQRSINVGHTQRDEYLKKLQTNVIRGTRKHLGLAAAHDDADVSPTKTVGLHDESYAFGSSTARADPRLGGKKSIRRRRRRARDVKRWRDQILRNTKPKKTKLNLVQLQRLLDSKGPRIWSIGEGGLGLRMPTPPTSAVTRGHITVLEAEALQSFGLLRKHKSRAPTLIVFKEIPKARPLIHVKKNGRESPFWPHRKKIKAFSASSMSLLILRVESSPNPESAKFWVSLSGEGRDILEDCLRELEKQLCTAIKKTKGYFSMSAWASSDAEFLSSPCNSPDTFASVSTDRNSPGDRSSLSPAQYNNDHEKLNGDEEEPVMFQDASGELFMEY